MWTKGFFKIFDFIDNYLWKKKLQTWLNTNRSRDKNGLWNKLNCRNGNGINKANLNFQTETQNIDYAMKISL